MTTTTAPQQTPPLTSIEQKRLEYVQAVRDYVKKDVDLWKRLPWLVLQARGRTGYSDHDQYVIQYKRYSLDYSGNGLLFVDCNTGELVYSDGRPATNSQLISGINTDRADAQSWINYYKSVIDIYKDKDYSVLRGGKPANWREEEAAKYGVVCYEPV